MEETFVNGLTNSGFAVMFAGALFWQLNKKVDKLIDWIVKWDVKVNMTVLTKEHLYEA